MNKHLQRTLSLSIIVLIVLFLIGNKAGWFGKKAENIKQAQQMQQAIPVSIAVAGPSELTDHIVTTGSILADEEVNICSEITGRLVSLLFTEGTVVNKGDLLAKLNDSEILAQINRNTYSLKLAQEREQRQKALLDKEAVSQDVYDQVLTELNVLKAEANLLQAQLQKSQIVAPFSGTIGLRQVSEGAYLSAGQPIVQLARTQPVKIEFAVPERYASSIHKGDEVEFSIDGNSESFTARVYATNPGIDINSRALPVRALFENKTQQVKPGNFASITIRLSQLSNALLVPAQAIIPELSGNKVFLFKAGKAVQSKVTLGIRNATSVQVTSGLSAGDSVITSGILQLRDQMPVTLQSAEK